MKDLDDEEWAERLLELQMHELEEHAREQLQAAGEEPAPWARDQLLHIEMEAGRRRAAEAATAAVSADRVDYPAVIDALDEWYADSGPWDRAEARWHESESRWATLIDSF